MLTVILPTIHSYYCVFVVCQARLTSITQVLESERDIVKARET